MKIYASNVAAIVGLNQFKDPLEAWQEMLDINKGIFKKESKEAIEEAMKFKSEVLKIRSKQKGVSKQAVCELLEDKIVEGEVAFAEDPISQIASCGTVTTTKQHKEKIIEDACLEYDDAPDFRITRIGGKSQVIDSLMANTKISDLVQSAPKFAISAVNKEYGIQQEEHQLRNAKGRQVKYTKSFGEGWSIVGAVDCIEGDCIIEVKNRNKRLFDRIPSYEKAQLMTYLWLSGKNTGYIEQHYRGTKNRLRLDYDEEWYADNVLKRLEELTTSNSS